jgi:hypothetical protein
VDIFTVKSGQQGFHSIKKLSLFLGSGPINVPKIAEQRLALAYHFHHICSANGFVTCGVLSGLVPLLILS